MFDLRQRFRLQGTTQQPHRSKGLFAEWWIRSCKENSKGALQRIRLLSLVGRLVTLEGTEPSSAREDGSPTNCSSSPHPRARSGFPGLRSLFEARAVALPVCSFCFLVSFWLTFLFVVFVFWFLGAVGSDVCNSKKTLLDKKKNKCLIL